MKKKKFLFMLLILNTVIFSANLWAETIVIPSKSDQILINSNNSNSSNSKVEGESVNALEKKHLSALISPKFLNSKIIDAQKYQQITVVHLSVQAADHSDAFVMVTPDNKIIDIDDYAILSGLDIKKSKNYAALAQKFPNISIWPGNHQSPNYKALPGNITQLIFDYRLLNGCHACALGGIAKIGFNFDPEHHYLGAVLVDLLPPPLVN